MGQCDCSLALQFPGSNSAHLRVFDGVWGREGGRDGKWGVRRPGEVAAGEEASTPVGKSRQTGFPSLTPYCKRPQSGAGGRGWTN